MGASNPIDQAMTKDGNEACMVGDNYLGRLTTTILAG